ncbi:hypothetical protein [Rhodoplanes sp. Z2-YC6860]|uniref:hypothetical protein n=1 Tax=Rhodoplanes sp. Z2-YC6860 TaxID=674703 RepID=UPI0012EDC3B1|nr:hypothetical protein [Rhodoplanes sp. Z2-YC6860]
MQSLTSVSARMLAGLGTAAIVLIAPVHGEIVSPTVILAAAPQVSSPPADTTEKKLTPEETMNRRFPQPVRVGFLIGLPILDWNDSTIGYIEQVVRTPEGKIQLIVPYHSWFGWLKNGGLIDRWRRPVAVPIETVAILARQVDALEMLRKDFDDAPTFQAQQAMPVPPDEQIRIAITRR